MMALAPVQTVSVFTLPATPPLAAAHFMGKPAPESTESVPAHATLASTQHTGKNTGKHTSDGFEILAQDRAVQKNPVSRLLASLIYGYEWVTRKTPLKHLWQPMAGKCFHRTVGQHPYSCSEFGLRAFQLYNPLWAGAITFLELLACGPHTELTPLGQLFREPLPPKQFFHKARELTKGLPLFYRGTPEDQQTFKHLMHTGKMKDVPAVLPPIRQACLNVSPLDWATSLSWASAQKTRLYDDGIVNRHLAQTA